MVTKGEVGEPKNGPFAIDTVTLPFENPHRALFFVSGHDFFRDGSATRKVTIDYPIGHRRRRAEAIPALWRKVEGALAGHLTEAAVQRILVACRDPAALDATPVHRFLDWFAV